MKNILSPYPIQKELGIVSFFLLSFLSLNSWAQMSLVNPVPQQISSEKGEYAAAPTSWRVVADEGRKKTFAYQSLAKSAIKQDNNASFILTIGVRGDKSIKKWNKNAPKHAEGYWLQLTSQAAVVVGADEEGLFYGIQTLLSSLSKGKLEKCSVTDWPDVRWRGTVEGFYGTPWSHEARLSQIEFYGRNKMNVYIYGPKDDPWHRDKWRVPYPESEAKRIQQLNEYAKANGVRFYWAIHPGVDIKWTVEDRDALISKLNKMYNLGIRSFAIFFDDIWGGGARADKQTELLNYVDNNFVQKKGDVTPLIMCPTEYNRAWANDEKGYLRTLGTKMNKSIQIMWTGNSVVHCIDKESMEWINQRIDRKAYIWWNFPVSDFVRDHILLGPAYGNDLQIANDLSGFVSNPMEHAESSKIALYGIADYVWNMKAYDADRDWSKALAYVLPSNTQALRTFALYNKDLGPNGHGFRREEGDELKDIAKTALKGNTESIAKIMQKSIELNMAADLLLTDKTNVALIRELRPWLLQAKNVANYGQSVCMLRLAANAPTSVQAFPTFLDLYHQAQSIQEQMYALENSDVRHALQPGIKVATKVMLPTLNQLFTQAVDIYNKANGTDLVNVAEYNPYKLTSDVAQLALLPITVRDSEVSVSPSNEVINWQNEGYLEISTDREFTFAGMDFNLGIPNIASNFKLEVLSGEEWKDVSLLHYNSEDPIVHTGNELGGMSTTRFRITNVSGKNLQVYFRSFKFVKQ